MTQKIPACLESSDMGTGERGRKIKNREKRKKKDE